MKAASGFPRSVRSILLGCILLTLVLRTYHVFTVPFDEDELRAFHLAWQVANGGVMWEEIKPLITPLFSLVHVPVFRALGDELSTLFVLRLSSLAYFVLFLFLFFLVGRTLAGADPAICAVFLISVLGFSIDKTFEFRPNSLALLLLMLSVWLYLRRDQHRQPLAPTLLAAVLLGIAYNIYQEVLLCFLAFALHQGLLAVLAAKQDRRAAAVSTLAFTLTYTATLALFILVPFSPVKAVHSLYFQFIVYVVTPSLGRGDPDILLRTVCGHSLFVLVSVLGLAYVYRTLPPPGRRRNHWFLWLLLMGVGVLRFTLTEKIFPQYFLLLGTILALPAGVFLAAIARTVPSHGIPRPLPTARLLTVAILLIIAGQGIRAHERALSLLDEARRTDAGHMQALFVPPSPDRLYSLKEIETLLQQSPYQRPRMLTQSLSQQLAFLSFCKENLGMSWIAFDGSSTYVFSNDSPNFNPPDLTSMYPLLAYTYESLRNRPTFMGVPRSRFGDLFGGEAGRPLEQALKEDFQRYPPDLVVYDPWVQWLSLQFPAVHAFIDDNYRFRYIPAFNHLIGVPIRDSTTLSRALPPPLPPH